MAGWSNSTATGQPQEKTTTFGPDSVKLGFPIRLGLPIMQLLVVKLDLKVETQPLRLWIQIPLKHLSSSLLSLMSGGTVNQKGEIQKRDAMTQFVTNLLGFSFSRTGEC
jgi:hypothetical protein